MELEHEEPIVRSLQDFLWVLTWATTLYFLSLLPLVASWLVIPAYKPMLIGLEFGLLAFAFVLWIAYALLWLVYRK